MIPLYIDEDAMGDILVRLLRAAGLDVLTAHEAGMRRTADEEHLIFAASMGRLIFSYNSRDFQRIHTAWMRDGRSHAGIALAGTRRWSQPDVAGRLARLALTLEVVDAANRLEYRGRWQPLP